MNVSETCMLCPRQCGVPRGEGFCHSPAEPLVASVCVHRGEEPPLNPIVNVFFAGCNLQCIYCQNRQISSLTPDPSPIEARGVDVLVDRICRQLPSTSMRGDGGEAPLLGFVTAAHYAYAVPDIVERLHRRGLYPTVVYNSSGYESVDTLRSLEGLVDIYLPDLKYMDPTLAAEYSHAPDYPAVALAAIREMMRQVGAGLKVDADGTAYRGLLVRHLVLPGHLDNTRSVLDQLSTLNSQFSIPNTLHLSLMAQYFPPTDDLPAPLDRTLTADEYSAAVDYATRLGFCNIWTQELAATDNYRPDFTRPNPFE